MSQRAAPGRADIVAMLAAFGERPADSVPERIGSLELTWLITNIEQSYQVTLDPTDEELASMTTLSGAVQAFRDLLAAAGQPSPGQPSPGQPSPGQPSPGQLSPGQLSPGQLSPARPGPAEPGHG